MKELYEEILHTVESKGFRALKDNFMSKKEGYKELLMDTDLDSEIGIANAKKYQAMYHTIDSFFEEVADIVKDINEKNKEADNG